jgi:hypothetical protein
MLSEDPDLCEVYAYNERTGMYCVGSGEFVHQSDVLQYAIADDGIMYIKFVIRE